MKKLTLSVAALTLAINSYSQCTSLEYEYSEDTVLVSNHANKAKESHNNLYIIVNNAEDMISMIEQDIDSGFIYEQYAGFYKELLANIIELAANTELKDREEANCENCDEID